VVPRNPADDNSGHIRISPGQGLEGIVTDLQSGRTRDEMLPFLREGRLGEGLVVGVERLSALIERGMGTPGAPPEERPRGPGTVILALGLFVFLVIVIMMSATLSGRNYSTGRRRRRRGGGYWGGFGGGGFGGGFGGGGFGGGGGGFGGFGGGGGFSGGGAGGRF
jgi:uncharacterized protein